jgi:uncharacterized protein
MHYIQFENIETYALTVRDYLLQEEAAHCLMLGLCSQRNFTEQPYLSVVAENHAIVAAAMKTPPQMKTPPHKLILSKSLSEQAIALIARNLAADDKSLSGIIAPQSEALTFAKLWQSLTGRSYRLGLAQRIYQLEVVQPITLADGYLRLADESDRSLLVSWIRAFTEEVIEDRESKANYEQWCDRRLQRNSLYIAIR